MTSAEVARHLGVTPGRVHQMVAEGALPQPIRIGARTVVWQRGLIGLPQTERSGVVASLPAAQSPALQLTARVVGSAYVRLYQTKAETVGVVSALSGWAADHAIGAAVSSAESVGASPTSVTWLVYSPDVGQQFWNVVFHRRRPNRRDLTLEQLGLVEVNIELLEVLLIQPVHYRDVVRVLGRCPGLFAPGTHTESVVQRLIDEQPTDALEVEDLVAASAIHDPLCHAQVLHDAVRDRWASPEFVSCAAAAAQALVGRARTVENAMGAVPPASSESPTDAVWVTRVIPVSFTAAEWELCANYPPGDGEMEGWRAPVSPGPLLRLIDDFLQWRERLAGEADELAAAFAAAAKVLEARGRRGGHGESG